MTQCEKILRYIKAHGSIEPLTAWRELGVYRLASRISDLRQSGIAIKTTQIKKGEHRFACYTLND